MRLTRSANCARFSPGLCVGEGAVKVVSLLVGPDLKAEPPFSLRRAIIGVADSGADCSNGERPVRERGSFPDSAFLQIISGNSGAPPASWRVTAFEAGVGDG
jgi:hypothetical protein